MTADVVCAPGLALEPTGTIGPCEHCGDPKVACEACDATGYTPTEMAPPLVAKGACSADQISGFVAACVSPNATAQTCQAWQTEPDAGACTSCILTMQTSAAWGPFVCTPNDCTANSGGCVDLELGTVANESSSGGAGSCGDAIAAQYGCEDYVCGGCTSPSDFTSCYADAEASSCKPYADAAVNGPCGSIEPDAAATPAGKCFPQSDTDVGALIDVFCGAGP